MSLLNGLGAFCANWGLSGRDTRLPLWKASSILVKGDSCPVAVTVTDSNPSTVVATVLDPGSLPSVSVLLAWPIARRIGPVGYRRRPSSRSGVSSDRQR